MCERERVRERERERESQDQGQLRSALTGSEAVAS